MLHVSVPACSSRMSAKNQCALCCRLLPAVASCTVSPLLTQYPPHATTHPRAARQCINCINALQNTLLT
jgi:hypothetical protein